MADQSEQFVRQLTESQNRLYGYVYSLIGDHTKAADILQETNLVLWRKINEFDSAKAFLPWAFSIARFQVMANLRDSKRSKLLLDESLAEQIADEVEQASGRLEDARVAMRDCLAGMQAGPREMLEKRYFTNLSVAQVAASAGKTVGAMKVALLRARRQLADCVEHKLGELS